ncbi:MAG TPA: hypothetical protein V6D09_09305 [Leptolyngbyaceae cyanobacterium]
MIHSLPAPFSTSAFLLKQEKTVLGGFNPRRDRSMCLSQQVYFSTLDSRSKAVQKKRGFHPHFLMKRAGAAGAAGAAGEEKQIYQIQIMQCQMYNSLPLLYLTNKCAEGSLLTKQIQSMQLLSLS